MVQLNLLPDVKLEYIKAKRIRRLVLSISMLVTAVAVAILVLVLIYDIGQKTYLNNLNNKINTETRTLQQKPDINKILTVQNQLESLTTLHDQEPQVSLLFSAYLNQITPASVSINNFNIDFTQNTIAISGNADSIATINKFVDTLKFTTYTTKDNNNPSNAFSNVVLTAFGVNSSTKDPNQAASYTINFNFDATIFDATKNAMLNVPNIITTRSSIEQPGDLFKSSPTSNSSTSNSTTGGGH